MESRVIELFHQSIEAKMACGEALAPSIVAASQLITQQLLQDKKVLCCGNGLCASLASMLTQCLTLQYRLERPGLPALCLNNDAATISAIAEDHNASEVFSKQLRTIGQAGDVLVTFSIGANSASLVQAIHAAHEHGMHVIDFGTDRDSDLSALLNDDDIQLCVINTEQHSVAEIHLLSLFSICELIDLQLFGGTE